MCGGYVCGQCLKYFNKLITEECEVSYLYGYWDMFKLVVLVSTDVLHELLRL